jgi:hypothetical protein
MWRCGTVAKIDLSAAAAREIEVILDQSVA